MSEAQGTYAEGAAQQAPPGMNEEEARLRLAQLQGKQREKFCPWLKEKCREDCASLFKGEIRLARSWHVSPPRCQSPMVTGIVTQYHQQEIREDNTYEIRKQIQKFPDEKDYSAKQMAYEEYLRQQLVALRPRPQADR